MPEWRKILILIVGLLEILVFSGTILGWTSLKLMLKKEGIYEYKCTKVKSSSGVTERIKSVYNTSNSLNETSLQIDQYSSSTSSPSIALANFSVQLNFTITATKQDDNKKSPKSISSSSSLVPIVEKTADQNTLSKRTIVIPFQATQLLNESFIYTLLRDSSVVLRSNRSDVELNLFSNTHGRNNKASNLSTLEQFIHLYMRENLETPVRECILQKKIYRNNNNNISLCLFGYI